MVFDLSLSFKPARTRRPTQGNWGSKDTLVLQWRAPRTDGGDKIEEYLVERKEVDKEVWSRAGASCHPSMEITGFRRGVSYNFRVFAKNSVGCSRPLIIRESFSAPNSVTNSTLTEVIDLTLEGVGESPGESGPGTLVLRGHPNVTGSGPSVGRDLAPLDASNVSVVACLEDEDSVDNAPSDTSDTEYREVDPAEEESMEDSDVNLPSPDDASG